MTQEINLDEAQQLELKERLRNERDSKIWRRLKCIDLKQRGHKHKEIAVILDVTIDTITDWLFIYSEGGFNELCKLNYEGRRISMLEQYKESIEEKIYNDTPPTVKSLQHWLKENLSIEIEHSWLSRWLKKNRLFLQKNPPDTR